MEYLPDYKMIADPPRTRNTNTAKNLKETLEKVIEEMHSISMGYVHGDLREGNVLYKEEKGNEGSSMKVKLVDFDWGGKADEVTYPPRLNPEINWHPDVTIDKPIKKEHDVYLIEAMVKNFLM